MPGLEKSTTKRSRRYVGMFGPNNRSVLVGEGPFLVTVWRFRFAAEGMDMSSRICMLTLVLVGVAFAATSRGETAKTSRFEIKKTGDRWELLRVPGLGPVTVTRIIKRRAHGGRIHSLDELGKRDRRLSKAVRYLKI